LAVFLGAVSCELPLTSTASFDPCVNALNDTTCRPSTGLPGQQGESRHCT